MSETWTLARMGSQRGKRFLITGANSGVGYSAAVELVRRGADVVLACRDKGRGEAALRKLRTETAKAGSAMPSGGPGKGGDAGAEVRSGIGRGFAAGRAELVELDLASLDSVRRVAEAEVARGLPLDGLINNAGVMAPPKRQVTKDGFEVQFGTNVLGHFALTCRLLPALARGRGSELEQAARVVTLSSIAHKQGRLRFDDLQSERSYSPRGSYADSKLADLMFAFELERRLEAARMDVISIAVHPGVAQSSLFKVGSGKGVLRVAEATIQGAIGLFLNSQLGGAIPTLFAATSPDAVGGGYYGSQGWMEMRGGDVGPAMVAEQARDVEAQNRLWAVCEELTGLTAGGPAAG